MSKLVRIIWSAIALNACVLVATGCSSQVSSDEVAAASRVVPTHVSDPAAWRLFDRSARSRYEPSGETITVGFAERESLAAVKVLGSAPYRLRVLDSTGASTAFGAIDLRDVGAGWHVFGADEPVLSEQVQLQFELIDSTAAAGIPELELWTTEARADGVVTRDATFPQAELAPGDCSTFEIELDPPASQWRRARLAFTADGIAGSFALKRSINDGPSVGGTWLGGNGPRAFEEEIDLASLTTATAEVELCLPGDASLATTLSDVRLVGELDRGVRLATSAAIGASARDATELVDDDPATTVRADANEAISLRFDRLVAPDAVVISGAGDALPRVECVGQAGATTELVAERRGSAVVLDGGANACASLSLRFDRAVALGDVDVVGSGAADPVDWPRLVLTSPLEHYGELAWVGGYTALPAAMTGAVRVTVSDVPATSMRGDYGQLLSRGDDPTASWEVALEAHYPDGTVEHRQVVLATDRQADLVDAGAASGSIASTATRDALFGAEGAEISVAIAAARGGDVRLGTAVGLAIPPRAVTRATTITARHLRARALPPLDPGMINVTAPAGRGYEFLPHGQRFARKVTVELPFEPRLVPPDMTPDDVQTYFYDSQAQRWKPLDRASIDTATHVVTSKTDHFTIMINAVLATPSNPGPLGFDPTTVSAIPSASPSAGIDLIAPPAATATGDANLALPIRLPPGRGAYTPELGITYNSGAGNGWLGLGWDLMIPHISIDTRWGVPTYADAEEPRYLLNGAELVPTQDVEGPACPSGSGRRYHARIEGAFAHILRCGSNPSNYYWVVRDRDGTTFTYGSQVAGNLGNPNVVSTKQRPCTSPPCGAGIESWNLRSVEDTHQNSTIFAYQVDDLTGAAHPEPARAVYPSSITYTSHPTLAAKYAVELILDDGTRPDQIVTGRGGFKSTIRKLLRTVRVKYDGGVVRDYVLTYAHGQFEKSVLKSVRVYGTGGCPAAAGAFVLPTCGTTNFLDDHTFDYLTETEGFAAAQAWTMVTDPDPTHATAARGQTAGWAASVTVGGSTDGGAVSASVGADVSRATRSELVGLYDMNGDGLLDQVFDAGASTPLVLYNKGAATAQFSATGPTVSGLVTLGRDVTAAWGVDANAGIHADGGVGASASFGISNSTARGKRLFADLDGDGFLDQASGSDALFSSVCPTGICFTPGQFPAATAINPGEDPLLDDFADEIDERIVLGDPVAQWTAPYRGLVALRVSVALVDSSPADGVGVELRQGDTLLGSWNVTDPAAPLDVLLPTMEWVSAGDAIYLRVSTGAESGIAAADLRDEVAADLTVTYMKACFDPACLLNIIPLTHFPFVPKTPTGALAFGSRLSTDLRTEATRPFLVPLTGTMRFEGNVVKTYAASRLVWCLQKFAHDAPTLDVSCEDAASPTIDGSSAVGNAVVTEPLGGIFPVQIGDQLVLRVQSLFSFDPHSIRFDLTSLAYTQACLPNGTGCTTTIDPVELAAIPLDSSAIGFRAAPPAPVEPPGWLSVPFVAPESGWYKVANFQNPFAPEPLTIAFRTNLQGQVFSWECITAECAYLPGSIPLDQGESLTIDVLTDANLFVPHTAAFALTLNNHFYNAPLTYHKRTFEPFEQKPSPFVGGYHGWRVGLWNEAFPFEPATFLSDIAEIDDACDALPSGTSCTDRLIELGLTAFAPTPSFAPISFASVPAPGYIGASSSAFVTEGGRMNVGRLGPLGPPVPGSPNLPDNGLYEGGYLRLSGTSSRYLGAGVSGGDVMVPVDFASLHGAISQSETRTTTDVLDMNGDGLADVIAGNQLTGSTALGVGLTSIYPFEERLRERSAVDYSIDLGGGATVSATSAGGRPLIQANHVPPDLGIGFQGQLGLGIGRSETTLDLVDLNADGLPDQVRRNGAQIQVRYNLGTSLGAWETIGSVRGALLTTNIDSFESFEETSTIGDLETTADALDHQTTLTQHQTRSVDLWFAKFSRTNRVTSSRVTRELQDLNGDGLPDLVLKRSGSAIQVQYNRGGGFGPATLDGFGDTRTWTTPAWTIGGTPIQLAPAFDTKFNPLFLAGATQVTGADVLAGTSAQTSVTRTTGFSIPLYSGVENSVSIGGSLSTSTDVDTFELALVDVTGDGAPDHVVRRYNPASPSSGSRLYVKRNLQTGRANLLSKVSRPLGGTITLDYAATGNTVDLPQQRQVLSRVEVADGVDLGTSFASPNFVSTLSYLNGKYDRDEREFMGFGSVTATRADGVTVTEQYSQIDFTRKGLLVEQTTRNAAGVLLESRKLDYGVEDVIGPTGTSIAADPSCSAKPGVGVASCTPKLLVPGKETVKHGEGSAAMQIGIVTYLAHDRFGNVTQQQDSGDDAYTTDDLTSVTAYSNNVAAWQLGRPTSIEVKDHTATIVRKRTGSYHSSGAMATVSVDTGSALATTNLEYDAYGNLVDVLMPPNADGERQRRLITYDPVVATYPVTVTDAFGYVSTADIYDYRFGVALHEIDVNGQAITRTLDAYGRLTRVSAPYAGSTPTITSTYFHTANPPRAVTVTTPAAPAGYSGPTPPATTAVTVEDGLGRVIEQRRSATVDGVVGMTTSGLVSTDSLGRTIRTYHPFFTAGASSAFIAPVVTAYTATSYDAQDRPIATTFPDGTSDATTYSLATPPVSGAPVLRKTDYTDPNGNHRESYSDLTGNVRVVVEHPTSTTNDVTQYDFDAFGAVRTVRDAEGNTTSMTYDRRGLRTRFDNPDTGLVEDDYDLAGNRTATVEPNHRALGTKVELHYAYDRLESIDFPSKPDINYTYGAPGATLGRAGRLASVNDETGTIQYEYGAYGEVRRELRTVEPLIAAGPFIFDTRTTYDSQGRLLQIRYPDGEVVTNTYDVGGLVAVSGQGTGWTRTYATGIRYDVFGNRTRLQYGNGAVSTWTFDPLSVRLAGVKTSLPTSTEIQQLALGYDANGNPTSAVSSLAAPIDDLLPGPSTKSHSYDGVNRLVTATGSAQLVGGGTTAYSLSFSYSPSHNIKHKTRSHTIDGAPVADTSFDAAYDYSGRPHLASAIGGVDITYDPSGNPLKRELPGGDQLMVWDDDGRMVEVGDLENRYDAAGLRVIRHDRDSDTHTVFGSAYFDLEGKTDGIKHVFAGAQRVASALGDHPNVAAPTAPTSPPTAYYFHADPLGSTAVVTNESGKVHQSLEYFADGGTWIDRAPSETAAGYLFNGKPFDAQTGFYDFGQRFYDPRTSLWLGIDPALLEDTPQIIGIPSSLAPAAYALNNPTGVVDPDGRTALCIPCVIGALLMMEDTLEEDSPSDWELLSRAAWGAAGAKIIVSAPAAGRSVSQFVQGTSTATGKRVAGAVVGGAVEGAVVQVGIDVAQREISSPAEYAKAATAGALLTFGGLVIGQAGRYVAGTYLRRGAKCFAAGTLVHTEAGLRAIEEVEIGDMVWASNASTGDQSLHRVANTFVTPSAPILEISTEQSGDRETFRVTPEHPFMTERGWIAANDLLDTDTVKQRSGEVARVVNILRFRDVETVYNLEVDEAHTYFVGRQGLLVHNTCVLNPAETAVFRGGTSMEVRTVDVKIDKKTGLVLPKRGLSLNTDAAKLESRFGEARQIKSVPEELQIVPHGKPGHFEIIPREAMPLQTYQELLNKVEFF